MGFWGPLLGGVLGGAASFFGQQSTNAMNKEEAEKMRQFNAREALGQRNWQEWMSNTSHQRQMKDLEKAGLNPIMAMHSGASTPGGGTASGGMATMENAAASGVSSAVQAAATGMGLAKLKQELKNMKTNEEVGQAQKGLLQEQKKKTNAETIRTEMMFEPMEFVRRLMETFVGPQSEWGRKKQKEMREKNKIWLPRKD